MCGKTKKQYVHPGRLHYEVWERRDTGNGRMVIEYICDTAREFEARLIAGALAERYKYAIGTSFVVRVKPREAHNVWKFNTADELEFEVYSRKAIEGCAKRDFADKVIEAATNGSGKPSPTVVKAIEKALK